MKKIKIKQCVLYVYPSEHGYYKLVNLNSFYNFFVLFSLHLDAKKCNKYGAHCFFAWLLIIIFLLFT